jgi:hypothetical protein
MGNKKNKKVTGKKTASSASKTLRSKSTSKTSKTSAGSALSQRKAPKKQTSLIADIYQTYLLLKKILLYLNQFYACQFAL